MEKTETTKGDTVTFTDYRGFVRTGQVVEVRRMKTGNVSYKVRTSEDRFYRVRQEEVEG